MVHFYVIIPQSHQNSNICFVRHSYNCCVTYFLLLNHFKNLLEQLTTFSYFSEVDHKNGRKRSDFIKNVKPSNFIGCYYAFIIHGKIRLALYCIAV